MEICEFLDGCCVIDFPGNSDSRGLDTSRRRGGDSPSWISRNQHPANLIFQRIQRLNLTERGPLQSYLIVFRFVRRRAAKSHALKRNVVLHHFQRYDVSREDVKFPFFFKKIKGAILENVELEWKSRGSSSLNIRYRRLNRVYDRYPNRHALRRAL